MVECVPALADVIMDISLQKDEVLLEEIDCMYLFYVQTLLYILWFRIFKLSITSEVVVG